MGRKSNSDKLSDLHAEALREFDTIQSAVSEERKQCLEDRRFYSIAGAQWEGPLEQQFENKLKLEVNKVHLAVIRIFNEYRNNRIAVTFNPKDGSKNVKVSEVCNDLYRANEKDSGAEEAYDNAFEEAVGGGFGAWRLRCEYEDEEDPDNDKQKICIEPIFDADTSVFFDLDSKRQDKADAKRCFVLTSMSYDAYEEEFDDDIASWPNGLSDHSFDWITPDVVYVAEYYRVEKVSETYHVFQGLDGQEQKFHEDQLDDDKLEELRATGFTEARQKKVKTTRVHKYLLSGAKVLEDCGFIAGKNIPIVPVFGKRWYVDNIERCMGHVRLAKDSQRLKNMQISKLGEISALSTVEKPIVSPERMSGHGVMWSEDNIKNYPYLLLNTQTDQMGNPVVMPMEYTRAPQVPPAMAALLQITDLDMKEVLGNQESGEQILNRTSGLAIELVQNKLDMQTYIYISNMSKAVKRSGEIWLSMAKDVFVEEGRKMKTLNKDEEAGSVELLKPVISDQTGELELENDLSSVDLDVSVDVGPTSNSKKSSTVRNLTAMMQVTQDPETLQVLSSMALMNMEGEGIADVRDFFRAKLVRQGVVKPTEEEAAQLQQEAANQQPDPNAEFLKASAAEAQAKAQKAMADAELTKAKTEQTKTDTVKTMAEMDDKHREHVLTMIQGMQQPQGIPNK